MKFSPHGTWPPKFSKGLEGVERTLHELEKFRCSGSFALHFKKLFSFQNWFLFDYFRNLLYFSMFVKVEVCYHSKDLGSASSEVLPIVLYHELEITGWKKTNRPHIFRFGHFGSSPVKKTSRNSSFENSSVKFPISQSNSCCRSHIPSSSSWRSIFICSNSQLTSVRFRFSMVEKLCPQKSMSGQFVSVESKK